MLLYTYRNLNPKLHPTVFIAPTAQIIGDVYIEKQYL